MHTTDTTEQAIEHDVDRRGFLRCMAWAGTGMLWTFNGGVPESSIAGAKVPKPGELFCVQISDSHIGFNKAANADVTETMRKAIAKIPVESRPWVSAVSETCQV